MGLSGIVSVGCVHISYGVVLSHRILFGNKEERMKLIILILELYKQKPSLRNQCFKRLSFIKAGMKPSQTNSKN